MIVLPEVPPKGLVEWVWREHPEELGRDLTIFKGERVRLAPTEYELYDNITVGKSVWATYCHCTACGEGYYTKKVEGEDGFYIVDGEDGCTYPLEPDMAPEGIDHTIVQVAEGDSFLCPYCCTETKAISAKRVRGGRTKRIQVASLHDIDGYAVIVYWLVWRYISEDGDCRGADPRYAYVLKENGYMDCYSHRELGYMGVDVPGKSWRRLTDKKDRWNSIYSDWGSFGNRKMGSFSYMQWLPDLTGTTGEKTGLLAYWRDSQGYKPVRYLKLWQKWQPVENLCTAGFSAIVEKVLQYDTYDTLQELKKLVDTSTAKPHEMLGVDKSQLRQLQKMKRKKQLADNIEQFHRYKEAGGRLEIMDFLEKCKEFPGNAMGAAIRIIQEYGDCDLEKLRRYMEKQNLVAQQNRYGPITIFYFLRKSLLIFCRVSARSSSSRSSRHCAVCVSSFGLLTEELKNSIGVMPKYSQIAKNSTMDGNDFPEEMLLTYPLLCPRS